MTEHAHDDCEGLRILTPVPIEQQVAEQLTAEPEPDD